MDKPTFLATYNLSECDLQEGNIAWEEVDHDIVYKEAEDDEMLRDYSKLLNRLSGLADEMSSYFRRMKQQKENDA